MLVRILLLLFFLSGCGNKIVEDSHKSSDGQTQVTFQYEYKKPFPNLVSPMSLPSIISNIMVFGRGSIPDLYVKTGMLSPSSPTDSTTLPNGAYGFFAFGSSEANFLSSGTLKCAKTLANLNGTAITIGLTLTQAECTSNLHEFFQGAIAIHSCQSLPASYTAPCSAPASEYGSYKLEIAKYTLSGGTYTFDTPNTWCITAGSTGYAATQQFNLPIGGTDGSSPVFYRIYAYPSGDTSCSTTIAQTYEFKYGFQYPGAFAPSGCASEYYDGSSSYHVYLKKSGTGC